MAKIDKQVNDLFFRRPIKEDLIVISNNGMDYKERRYIEKTYAIVNENETVGIIRYSIKPGKVIEIESISIFQEFRRKGYGTKAILFLKNEYRGFKFWGDILYSIAFDFWRNFDDGLDYYDEDCGCISFSFT